VPPQIEPWPGLPDLKAVKRHRVRVHEIMHTLPESALEAIRADSRARPSIAVATLPEVSPSAS
jgi:hypothetical protein